MSFRRNAPTVLIATVIFVLVGMAFASNRLFASLTEEIEADRFQLMRAVVQKTLLDTEDSALARAEMFARLGSVQTALGNGDRDALLREIKPSFDAQKERFGVRKAELAVPPATIFVRLHKPAEGVGEDLSSFRPIIVDANARHEALKGVAISRSGPSIAGVAPIADALGQHLGTLEFGMDFAPMLDGIKSTYGLDAAVYFEEATLVEVATKLPADLRTDANRVGEHLRFYSTNADRIGALVTDKDLASNDERQYVRQAFGVPYGVVVLPIGDHLGRPIGLVSVVGDFSSSRASASRMVVWQALMVLVGGVICAGTILVVVRGMILRPLQALERRFAALVAGDGGPPIDVEAEGFCEEMVQLAKAHEALRQRGGGAS